MEKELLDLLMDLKGKISSLEGGINNIKADMADMKVAIKEMVEIEKRQQRIEDNYNRLLDCCEEARQLKMEFERCKSKCSLYHSKVDDLIRRREVESDRFWKVMLSIIEKIILWILIAAMAYKLHLY
jgi:predicted RNase H-like nuclease (RuvC/YqgF family)